jgi:4-diphosphocytidyl-2-C-methyl-D-erythritol kinase
VTDGAAAGGRGLAEAFAPAKVNLYLHVGPARADGFHPIASLMAFADVGDRLELITFGSGHGTPPPGGGRARGGGGALSEKWTVSADRASPGRVTTPIPDPSPFQGEGGGQRLSLKIVGPLAAGVPTGEDNLVLRAARALYARAGVAPAPLRIELTKALPAEAGLGGGSSDAAAALRLLNGLLERPLAEDVLVEIAAGLGSDVPACVAALAVTAEGRGERLSPAPALPPLDAVLVKPPAGASTAAVYGAFDAANAGTTADLPARAGPLASARDAAVFLAACRNDLEAPAVSVQPLIGEVLALLREQPETLLGRMSGSGSACFAICASATDARRLAERLAARQPDWWVAACRLG